MYPSHPRSQLKLSQPGSHRDESIKEKVLEIVAEKTGYPKEMLDMDLDLEADLGIDTVKQAEMFAAVRAAYNIPRDETIKLRDFPTLASVIKFARDRAGVSGMTASTHSGCAVGGKETCRVCSPGAAEGASAGSRQFRRGKQNSAPRSVCRFCGRRSISAKRPVSRWNLVSAS